MEKYQMLGRRISFAPFSKHKYVYLRLKTKISGKTCPFPGSLPHGNWSCEMQEIPIRGTSFLDEDAQSYPGKEFAKFSYFLVWNPGTQ